MILMPSHQIHQIPLRYRILYRGDGIVIREVQMMEVKKVNNGKNIGKEDYKELFSAVHSFETQDGGRVTTSLRISERQSDGRVFLSLFRDDSRITISLSKTEIAELYAVLSAYVHKRFA